jgi:hypothetical protein
MSHKGSHKCMRFCQLHRFGNPCAGEKCQNVRHAMVIISKFVAQHTMKIKCEVFFVTT